MPYCSADFETGVDGATVTTSDLASDIGFGDINIGTGGTVAYDNDHAYGSLALKIAGSNPADNNHVGWGVGVLNNQTGTHYGRAYMYWETFHNTSMRVIGYLNSGSNRARINVNSTGKVVLYDTAGTAQYTSSASVNQNGWTRLEWKIIQSTTAGDIECKIFLDPDSTTPDETFGGTLGNLDTSAQCNTVRFGYVMGTGTNQPAYWIDNIVAGATSYPGPAVVRPDTIHLFSLGVEAGVHNNMMSAAAPGWGAVAWPSANRIMYVPVAVPRRFTVRKFAVLNGATTSGNLDIGLYSPDGVRLVSTGSMGQSGVSLVQEVGIDDIELAPGWYYLALVLDNATGTIQRAPSTTPSKRTFGCRQQDSTFPLPATATFAAVTDQYWPAIKAMGTT